MLTRKNLVVFDFDWSLVEENSDTWVLQKLGGLNIFKRLQSHGIVSFGILIDCMYMYDRCHDFAGIAWVVRRQL